MEKIRQKIDEIDENINELLDERAQLVREIGVIKKKNNSPVYSPGREKKIIDNIISHSKKVKDGFPLEAKINVFREIFSVSRAMQKRLKISFLGPETTFTHQAAVEQFSSLCDYVSAASIPEVFREVERGRADYGVVPIENSTEGIVSHTLDKFLDSDCKICAELLMEIHLNLLSKEKEMSTIKKIYSHPQPLGQCRIWLEEHFPGAEFVEVSSTARASQMAQIEPNSAAVASSMAAEIYDLNILAEKIEDLKENITRFFIIGKEIHEPSENSKTTIMFSIKDRVGALHDILVPFKKSGLNLTKIESRPSRIKAWEYVFFVDLVGHINDPKVKKALDELEKNCAFLNILGSYPAATEVIRKNYASEIKG
jgi:chorismate mutase/prephenate dehydratase